MGSLVQPGLLARAPLAHQVMPAAFLCTKHNEVSSSCECGVVYGPSDEVTNLKTEVVRIKGGNCGEVGHEFTHIIGDRRLAISTTFHPAVLVTSGPDMNAGCLEVTKTAG